MQSGRNRCKLSPRTPLGSADGPGHDAAAGRDRHRGHDPALVQGRGRRRSPRTSRCSRCPPTRSTPRCRRPSPGSSGGSWWPRARPCRSAPSSPSITADLDEPPSTSRAGDRAPRPPPPALEPVARRPSAARSGYRFGAMAAGRSTGTVGRVPEPGGAPAARRARARPGHRRRQRARRAHHPRRRAGRGGQPRRRPAARRRPRRRPAAARRAAVRRAAAGPRRRGGAVQPGPPGHRPSTWPARWPRRPTRWSSSRSTTRAVDRVRRGGRACRTCRSSPAPCVDGLRQFPHVNALVGDDA